MGALGIFAGLAILIALATSKSGKGATPVARDLPSTPPIAPPPQIPSHEDEPIVETEMVNQTVSTPKGTVTVPVKTETKTVQTEAGPVTTETKTVITPQGPITLPSQVAPTPATHETKTVLTPQGAVKTAPAKPAVSRATTTKWFQVNGSAAVLKANMSSLPKYGVADFNKPPRWTGPADRLIVLSYDKANKAKITGFNNLPAAGAEFSKRVASKAYPYVKMLVRPKDSQTALVTLTEYVA